MARLRHWLRTRSGYYPRTRRKIMRLARKQGLAFAIPPDWNRDGSLRR